MTRNMALWLRDLRSAGQKKALPILSFPSVQLLGCDVRELIGSSERQAQGMKRIADRCQTVAAVSMMDLSVEAEAFGAAVRFTPDEVPTVTDRLVDTAEEAEALAVPAVGAGRTGRYVEAIGKAAGLITDRPVLSGVIGPFSLAGRLMDMTEIMIKCYEEPETVHAVLEKAAEFITEYIQAFRSAGASGVILAEPAAGLLSPKLNEEFSTQYVKRIFNAVKNENFVAVYHNCGNTVPLLGSLLTNGADAYHFGNAVDMAKILELLPGDVVAMGNIDPAGQFRNGTPQSVYQATASLLARCGKYPNWVVSSGCDIPPMAAWENIDAFFAAVRDYNGNHSENQSPSSLPNRSSSAR